MINVSLFATHEAQRKATIMRNTWGHLDAKPYKVYPCKILKVLLPKLNYLKSNKALRGFIFYLLSQNNLSSI